MSRRSAGRASLLAVTLLSSLSLAASAAPEAAAPGTKAVLEIEYVIEGRYASKGEYDSINWQVSRWFKASYEITAQELAKFGSLDMSHTEETQPQADALGQQAQQMAVDNADMMARAQAIMEACGDDEACIEQQVMALGQSAEAQGSIAQLSSDGQAMSQSAQAFDANSPPRFQLWNAPKGRAEASVKESLVYETQDPGCVDTGICTTTRDRDGKADYKSAEDAASALVMVEVDTAKNSISVGLPWPMVPVPVRETTQDGASSQTVILVNGQQWDFVSKEMRIVGRPIEGSYKDQSGELSFKLPDLDDYAAPVDVRVRWRFKVL
ncbi:MAG TPA: hypothetical protein VJJ77_08225 [Dongiaceae bacterium]|nr:hypothetical protein [Dongiaceae bacterium]